MRTIGWYVETEHGGGRASEATAIHCIESVSCYRGNQIEVHVSRNRSVEGLRDGASVYLSGHLEEIKRLTDDRVELVFFGLEEAKREDARLKIGYWRTLDSGEIGLVLVKKKEA
jgi:hypothetical protein